MQKVWPTKQHNTIFSSMASKPINRLEPVLRHIEKFNTVFYCRKFSMNIRIMIIELNPVLLAPTYVLLGLTKLVLIFNILC